ncbi:MAG: DUF1841 family protein [Myxococcales bacterium]|nr:DUF1841 family protein [Myxococcales bacterium]
MADPQQALFERLLAEHVADPHPGLSDARLRLHVTMHVVVETQIESGDPPQTRETLERLIGEGLERHDAVHAICSVVADELLSTLEAQRYDAKRYATRLASLSARVWRAKGSIPGAS